MTPLLKKTIENWPDGKQVLTESNLSDEEKIDILFGFIELLIKEVKEVKGGN